jgi:chaperone BCS1
MINFGNLQGVSFDALTSNSTVTSLPSVLLDSLIPGYGLISQIIYRIFGFDIGLAVSGCIVVYGLSIGARLLYYKSEQLFYSYFMSSVQIEDDDAMFGQVMDWIAEQRMTKRSRSLKAVTKWVSAWHESEEERNASDDDVLDESGIFNYEKWASTIPPQYEPNFGSDRFWFGGRMFFFCRTRREKQVRSWWGRGEDQYLDISCIGRSTEPIKELLSYIKRWTLTKDSSMTAIHRPAPKEKGEDSSWDRTSLRPSRPISTVSLDHDQKAKIVNDINEYLHPASARWYAARGIPYRRGYLFHGPPGTGKTSLSFALAGIFGLDIYCLSIMEVGLTEADLNRLFAELPRRCIVLLEDIDSAGLRRPDEPTDSKDAKSKKGSTVIKDESSDDDASLRKITKSDLPGAPTDTRTVTPGSGGFKSLISLSGLLNAIDGVASHEGRVLIMTTNCPSKLDRALIRPGRVDLQVEFTLATHEQIRDIYVRMYSTDRDDVRPISSSTSTSSKTAARPSSSSGKKTKSLSAAAALNSDDAFFSLLTKKPQLDIVESPEKLRAMADEFAGLLPDGKLSPAEIQGFLLTRKKEPRRALLEVERWRDALLESKESEEREGRGMLDLGVQ